MRLSGFHIKNFRSIVNTGCDCLSPDNITALIGQNESGKTSVLEALYSFSRGSICEDVLRSDMSFPEVSCTFTAEPDEIESVLQKGMLLEEAAHIMRKTGKVTLTRKWDYNIQSNLFLSGNEVTAVYDDFYSEVKEKQENILEKGGELIEKEEETIKLINDLEKSLEELKKKRNALSGKLSKTIKLSKKRKQRNNREKLTASAEAINNDIRNLEELKEQYSSMLDEKKRFIVDNEMLNGYAKQTLQLAEKIEQNSPYYTDNESKTGLSTEILKKQLLYKTFVLEKFLKGQDLFSAEKEAAEESEAIEKYTTREHAGKEFFNLIPGFEFFEDFSSLLPNRIDLDDIFTNNLKAEGFKAVKNFLMVAGLEPGFFMQSNNRILKQKIENLNGEITVDFQEYWSQNVGKANKIKINFELEHYDYSHPEKKGKPYLEFWIKDEHERLYPKQRSRGVRWFLSFYLELKANARHNEKIKQVLLIDEPGLSLHARAQEDVLKVFEDIKESMQIVYTTHSPNLLDMNKLYRLMAVQREQKSNYTSETVVYSAQKLHTTTNDTLSPLYSLMGTRLWEQPFVQKKNNVIVQDICSYHYLSTLYRLAGRKGEIFFIPATGISGIAPVANILLGWGVEFVILIFNGSNKTEGGTESKLVHFADGKCNSGSLVTVKKFNSPEDLFSTLDFKKFILNKRTGITGTNSTYVEENNMSRELLSASFSSYVKESRITLDDFDEETIENITRLFELMENSLAAAAQNNGNMVQERG